MTRILIGLIHLYRWCLSPFLGKNCRFEPTCSRYAIHALEIHGLFKGITLVCKRLLRCQPFDNLTEHLGPSSGYDPIPKKNLKKSVN